MYYLLLSDCYDRSCNEAIWFSKVGEVILSNPFLWKICNLNYIFSPG